MQVKHFARFAMRDLDKAKGALAGVVLLLLLFTVWAPGFMSSYNMASIGVQASVLVLLAVGQTFAILSEGIDLSSGGVLTLSGVVMAVLLDKGWGPSALLIGVLIGPVFGLITGLLISRGKLPPFIASLGVLGATHGLSLVLSNASSIANFAPWVVRIVELVILGIPLPIWIALAAALAGFAVLYATRFGSYVVALGGNREAAKLSGVPTVRVETMVYVVSGLFASLAGVLMAARLNSAHPYVGVGMEFDAVAAVIVGGTSFARGNGGMLGCVAGVALISILRNGMNIAGVNAYWQLPVIGGTIILAIIFSTLWERRQQGRRSIRA